MLTADRPIRAKEKHAMPNGHFADVNGQHVIYCLHDSGKPLVVLHAGISADSFGGNLAQFARARKVIAPHLQAH
ncbi:MAG: alpha/beta hydrolase, partial [Rhodanobacteraceae bacterium]